MPIRELNSIYSFPLINIKWNEWTIYEVLRSYSDKLDVSLSNDQLSNSIPIVAPKGKMNHAKYVDYLGDCSAMSFSVDDLNNLDDLVEEMLQTKE